MTKNLVAIIGGTKAQLPLVNLCYENNFTPVVIDRNANCFLRKYCTNFINLDFSLLEDIRSLSRNVQFRFAVTHQSDAGVQAAAIINEKSGIDALSFESAVLVSDKIRMRRALQNRILQPKFITFSHLPNSDDVIEFGFPCVIKIAKSSGSRGVMKLENVSDLYRYIGENGNRKSENYILEEYIDGIEFGVQTLHLSGNRRYMIPHNDKVIGENTPVPIGHSLPFRKPELTNSLEQICDEIASSLCFSTNAGNFDFKLSEKGEIYFIEVGGRMGATGIPKMIQYHFGIDVLGELFHYLAQASSVNSLEHKVGKGSVSTEILKSYSDGRLEAIPKLENYDCEFGLIDIDLVKEVGDEVKKFRTGNDKLGEVFVHHEDIDSSESLASYFVNRLESDFTIADTLKG